MATFRTPRIGLMLLVTPLIANCRPCDCEECQMTEISIPIAAAATSKNVTRGTLHFDYNFFSPSDDDFSLRITYTTRGRPGEAATDTVSGTYNKSGDTVTFNASKVSSTLLPNGVKYSVTCQDKKLVFKRTGAPDLSFDCSKS
jgi:hypothetical protein